MIQNSFPGGNTGCITVVISGTDPSGITVSMGMEEVNRSAVTNADGVAKLYFSSSGVYALSAPSTVYGLPQTITVAKGGQYTLTAYTDMDVWQAWVQIAGLDPANYENLAAVVANAEAMETLANTASAVAYMIGSTQIIMPAVVASTAAMTQIGLSSSAMDACIASAAWAAAIVASENAIVGLDASSPILVPAMTGYTAPEGTVSGSSYYIHNAYFPWQAFSQRQPSTAAMYIGSTGSPQWLAYEYADGVTVWLYKIKYKTDSYGYAQPKDIELHGSNDGFMTYDVLGTYEQAQEPGGAEHVLAVNAAAIKRYKAIRFYATTFHNPYSAYSMCICDVQFYGK